MAKTAPWLAPLLLLAAPLAAQPAPLRTPTAAEAADLATAQKAFEAAFQKRDWNAAADALKRTLAIQDASFGPEHPMTLTTLGTYALALQLGGRSAEAEPLFRRELATRRKQEGEKSAPVARAYGNLALSLDRQGKLVEAEPFFRSAVASWTAVSGAASADAAQAQMLLASALGRAGRTDEALAQGKQARDAFLAKAAPNSAEAADAHELQGRFLVSIGRFDEADTELTQALAIRTKAQGEKAAPTLMTMNALGIALTQKGDYKRAEPVLRRALAGTRALKGAKSPDTADVLNNLATAIQNGGDPATAEPMLREVLAIQEAATGPGSPATLSAVGNLATCLNALGRYADAEPLSRHALEGRVKLHGENHPETAIAAGNLAAQLSSLGREIEAESLYRRALASARASLGQDHPNTAVAYSNLGFSLVRQGRFTDGEELHRKALAIRRKALSPDNPDTAENLGNIAYALDQQRRFAEATPLFREALDMLRKRYGENNPSVARAYNNLASNLDNLGKPAEAAPLYQKSLAIRRATLGPDHPATLLSLGNVGYSYYVRGDRARAVPLYRQVIDAQRRIYGPDNPERVTALTNLAMTLVEEPTGTAESLRLARESADIARRRRSAILAGKAAGSDSAAQAQVRARSADALRDDPLVTSFIGLMQVDWTVANRDGKQLDPLRAEAFEAAQEIDVSRAGQAMARTAARAAAGKGELGKLVAQQQALTDRIAALDEAIAKAATGSDRAVTQRLTAELATAAAELDTVDRALAQRFPDYQSLVAPTTLAIPAVQQRLKPGEGLLLIVPSNGDMFSFAVTPEKVAWTRAPKRQTSLKTDVARLLCQVDPVTCARPEPALTPFEKQGYAAFDRDTAYGLYKDLIAPLEPALADTKMLYVTATGTLGTLPLGLLVTAPPQPGDDADPAVLARTPWLAERYALTALPAVSTLRALKRSDSVAQLSFVGYGAPALKGEAAPARARGVRAPTSAVFRATGQGPAMADQQLLKTLDPLPGTQRELSAMAKALDAPKSALRLAEADTEAALKRDPQLPRARVIAFATHGLLPRELGGFDEPGLVFTPPAQASMMDDGVLAASEAAELKINADWVILSACNTAGAESGAESLSGLARAFLYAGAGSLLATHWRVSDEATAVLTVETLAADKALPRAEALAAGMRAVRTGKRADGSAIAGWDASWAHPQMWAPFSLISDQNR